MASLYRRGRLTVIKKHHSVQIYLPKAFHGIEYVPVCKREKGCLKMSRKSKGNAVQPRSKKSIKPALNLALLLGAALLGSLWAFNLEEERRTRIRKLLSEAREMPFRLFV